MTEFLASSSVVMWKVEGLSNTPLVYVGELIAKLLKRAADLFLVLIPKYKRTQTGKKETFFKEQRLVWKEHEEERSMDSCNSPRQGKANRMGHLQTGDTVI